MKTLSSKFEISLREWFVNNYQIDRGRWGKMTILEQMGNIGIEVGRAIKAKRNGENDLMIGAIDRTLDLFDATTEILIANKSPRVKEVLRAEDQFLNLFFDDNFTDADSIDDYFMQYALAARNGRG